MMENQYQLDLDTTEICRACLAKNCTLNNLYCNQIVDGEIVSMPMVYSIGTGLTINENDGFPAKICGNCEAKIIDNYIFKQKCKKSCELLKKILNIKDIDDAAKKQTELRSIDTQTESVSQNDADVQTDELETDSINAERIDSTDYDIDFGASNSEELYRIDEEDEEDDGSQTPKKKRENEVLVETDVYSDEELVYEYQIERLDENDEKDETISLSVQTNKIVPARKRRRAALDRASKNSTKSTEMNFECKLCSKKLESTAFEMHMQDHLEVMTIVLKAKSFYRCSSCRFLFLTSDELLNHFENDCSCNQTIEHSPDAEDEKFSELISSQIDKIRLFSCYRVTDDFFACELCDVACETIDIFEKHFNDEHLEAESEIDELFSNTAYNRHSCSLCQKSFQNLRSAIYHMFFHQTQLCCPFEGCYNFYTKFGFLHRHITIEHIMKARDTIHRCGYCDFETNNFDNFKMHRKECSGRQFQCSYCDKSFFLSYTLKIHERTHTNETRHVCHICNKQFVQSNDLRNHERIHSGERPYKCDICEKKFKTQSHRSDHLATHNNENKFACDLCGNKFKSARILRGHRRIHQEKTITCEKCDKRFTRPYHLKSHMKVHE